MAGFKKTIPIRKALRWMVKKIKKLDDSIPIMAFIPIVFFVVIGVLMLLGILKVHIEF